MYNSLKYDWEVRDDAETLRKYQEIKSNPERFSHCHFRRFLADGDL